MCLEWNDRVAAMHGLEITYPFFDRDLVGFLMSVPGEIVSHGGVPKALLREAMRGKVPESICARRWKANFLGPINQGLVWDYDQILERLESFRVSSESGYVDHHALVPRLAQIRAGLGTSNDESAAAVLDLLGLEVWLRVFMQPEKRPAAGGAGDEFW
jgi:asparagine synthase (glutamine-hydrolysing)